MKNPPLHICSVFPNFCSCCGIEFTEKNISKFRFTSFICPNCFAGYAYTSAKEISYLAMVYQLLYNQQMM